MIVVGADEAGNKEAHGPLLLRNPYAPIRFCKHW
jgi:hypothetical protein